MNHSEAPSCSGRGRGQSAPQSRQTLNLRAQRLGRRRCIIQPREIAASLGSSESNGAEYRRRDEDDHSELPTRWELSQRPDKQKPTVRVKLSVHYRVHSRQILCIGGSQIPLGWSFLSIAKVPMTWTPGDVWVCEVRNVVSMPRASDGPNCLVCRWSCKLGKESSTSMSSWRSRCVTFVLPR